MYKAVIAGMGPGDPRYTIPYVFERARRAEAVIVPRRYEALFPREKTYVFSGVDETLVLLSALLQNGDVMIAVSGDSLVYSFAQTIQKRLPEIEIELIPGISSVQALAARAGVSMDNAAILSLHGRRVRKGTIAMTVACHEKTFFLCSRENSPSYIQEVLEQYGLKGIELIWGSNLTTEQEETGTILRDSYPSLTVCLVQNSGVMVPGYPAMLRDCDFIRGKTPMTRENVRAIVLLKLGLTPDAILWDIGAGTGSISIEAARRLTFGAVYSIEKSHEAVSLLALNKEKFLCDHMHICEGDIFDQIDVLPDPDAVFVGGGGRHIGAIIKRLKKSALPVRLVMTAVTLETQSLAFDALRDEADFHATDITVSESTGIGSMTGMKHENTVRIFSCIIKPKAKEQIEK